MDLNKYNVQGEQGLANHDITVVIISHHFRMQEGVHQFSKSISIICISRYIFFNDLIFSLSKYQNYFKNADLVQVHDYSHLMTSLVLREAKRWSSKTVLYQGLYSDYTRWKKIFQGFVDLHYSSQLRKYGFSFG